MIKIVGEYIKYKWNAKQRFGVHSPFVYEFGDKCLNLSIPNEDLEIFRKLKRSFLKNNDTIEVNDLGAGSKRLNNQRKISQIARVSGSSNKYGMLLYRICSHYNIERSLELGTSLGLGTFMLAAGNKNNKVITIEGCKNTLKVAQDHFPKTHINQVQFVNSNFVDYLKSLNNEPPFDLIFIDGDHQSKSLFEQLNLLESYIHDETIIILDDIRWSDDMLKGWNKLVNDSRFHVSLDLFRMGILVKRQHQQKEHFVVGI